MASHKLLYALISRGTVVLAEHRWALRRAAVVGGRWATSPASTRSRAGPGTRHTRARRPPPTLLLLPPCAHVLHAHVRSTVSGNANTIAIRILERLPTEDT